MMVSDIPANLRDLFSFERPIVAALATLMPSGQPQVTPVWFMTDGDFVIVNSARGRQKDRNMSKGARVTLLIIDPQNPMHWAEVRGAVTDVTEEGGYATIKRLALKYRGVEEYQLPEGQVRVTYKIAINKVNGN